jgi:hypothetical protein
MYIYSLKYNGQHVSTRYRVIVRPIGAYVLVHEKNVYAMGSHSVYIRVYWPDDDPITGRNMLPIVPQWTKIYSKCCVRRSTELRKNSVKIKSTMTKLCTDITDTIRNTKYLGNYLQ